MKKWIMLSLVLVLSACTQDFRDEDRYRLYESDDSVICSEYPDRCLEEGITW